MKKKQLCYFVFRCGDNRCSECFFLCISWYDCANKDRPNTSKDVPRYVAPPFSSHSVRLGYLYLNWDRRIFITHFCTNVYPTDRLFKIFLVNRTGDTKPTVVSSVITKRVFSLATVRSGQVRSVVVPAIHHYYCYPITRISTIIRVYCSMSSRAARGQSWS